MTREISLTVNGAPIALDYFVSAFIDHTVAGMLASLHGTGEIGSLQLAIEGETVTIDLNNTRIPANEFVSKVIRNTIFGLVASLKGVSGQVKSLKVTIKR